MSAQPLVKTKSTLAARSCDPIPTPDLRQIRLLSNTTLVRETTSEDGRLELIWPKKVFDTVLNTLVVDGAVNHNVMGVKVSRNNVSESNHDTASGKTTFRAGFITTYSTVSGVPVRSDAQVCSSSYLDNVRSQEMLGVNDRFCGGPILHNVRREASVFGSEAGRETVRDIVSNPMSFENTTQFGVSPETLRIVSCAAKVDYNTRFKGREIGSWHLPAWASEYCFPRQTIIPPIIKGAPPTVETSDTQWPRQIFSLKIRNIKENQLSVDMLEKIPRQPGGKIQFPIVSAKNATNKDILYHCLALERPSFVSPGLRYIAYTQLGPKKYFFPKWAANSPVSLTSGDFYTPPMYANYLNPLDISLYFASRFVKPEFYEAVAGIAKGNNREEENWVSSAEQTISDVSFADFTIALVADYATNQGIAPGLFADGGYYGPSALYKNSDLSSVFSNISNGLKAVSMEAPLTLNTSDKFSTYVVTDALTGIGLLCFQRRVRPCITRQSMSPGDSSLSVNYTLALGSGFKDKASDSIASDPIEQGKLAVRQIAADIQKRVFSLPAKLSQHVSSGDEFLGAYVRQILVTATISLSPETPLSLVTESPSDKATMGNNEAHLATLDLFKDTQAQKTRDVSLYCKFRPQNRNTVDNVTAWPSNRINYLRKSRDVSLI